MAKKLMPQTPSRRAPDGKRISFNGGKPKIRADNTPPMKTTDVSQEE